MKKLVIIFVVMFCVFINVGGQTDSTSFYRITLNDESELMGAIVEKNDSQVVFKTLSGLVSHIDVKMISEINEIKGELTDKGFVRYDPNRTRLLFGPTARSLPSGKGYFSVYEIFFPFIAVGVTDYITLSGGMTLIPGAEEQMVYFAPKVRFFETEQVSVGGGVLFAHFSKADWGIFYGVTTIGNQRNALTIGAGYGFSNGEVSDNPVIMLGGELQVSNSLKFITENWIPPGSDGVLISFGLRFFGDNLATDFGLITTSEASDGFPFIPWLGFATNF